MLGYPSLFMDGWSPAQFGNFPAQTHLIQLISFLLGLVGVFEQGNHHTLLVSSAVGPELAAVILAGSLHATSFMERQLGCICSWVLLRS